MASLKSPGVWVIDWAECEEVECVPGKVAGQPVIRGTRVPAEAIVAEEELGSSMEETHESFPTASIDSIRKVLAYARSRNPALQS